MDDTSDNTCHLSNSESITIRFVTHPASSALESPPPPHSRFDINRAKEAWRTTDLLLVSGYSFLHDRLRIHFPGASLDIIAEEHRADWKLEGELPLLPSRAPSQFKIIHEDRDPTPVTFNRHLALEGIVGRQIRYSSTPRELYVCWEPDLEIAFSSYQIVGEASHFLYYTRSDYRRLNSNS